MKFATCVFVAVIFSGFLPCFLTQAARINRLKMGKTNVEDYLLLCWEEFVSSMSTGIPELNIPAFDPWLSQDHFPFRMQDSNMALRADVNATNVESLGFSSVQISSVQENTNSCYNVSLTLPDLDISGIYSLVGSHHYFYPIVGYGPFRLTLRNVWTTGTTTLLFEDNVYKLTKLELTPLSYGSAASEYFNLSISGADSNSETFISFTNLLTESLWYQVEEELRMQLSESITEYLNKRLLDFHPSSSALLTKKLKKIKHF